MSLVLFSGNAKSVANFRGELIKQLLKSNIKVTVVIPNGSSEQDLKRITQLGAQYKTVPMKTTGLSPASDLITFICILIILRKIKPTYALAYTIKPIVYGIFAARCLGIEKRFALITGLGYVFLTNSIKGKLLRKLVTFQYKVALKKAKAVIFQNPDDQKEFLNYKIAGEKQSHIVNGSGVDIDYYQPSPDDVSQPISFLLVARLLKDKGIYEYISAAREIKKKYPEVVFKLLGYIDGNPAAVSKQEVDSWVREGMVEFLGKKEDVRPALANCHVFVLPSYREGTPRSVLEAMSVGRAIITTDAPGCRETVLDGVNGFLVPVKSSDALYIAMEKFILNPNLISTMGIESRKVVQEKYDVHKVNQRMFEIMGIV